MDTIEHIQEKQDLIQNELRGPGIRVNWPDVKETLLESWLSRGDRKLSNVIEKAWRLGAKFDAWQDHFDDAIWLKAFAEEQIDPNTYSHRARSYNEPLPWEHISMGVSKIFLIRESELSKKGKTQDDCSQTCHACGILPLFEELRNSSDVLWKCPESAPADGY